MILVAIVVLLVTALALIWSIVASRDPSPAEQPGVLHVHSDYRQLRIEYHQSIDKSLSPPK
jgi:hypothetical protein